MDKPLLMTAINYSAGKPSTMLVYEVIFGEVPRPENLIVQNADPGGENSESYEYAAKCAEDCAKAGIPFVKAKSGNLHTDLVSLTVNQRRVDNPPFWTVDENNKIGRLMQKCTHAYKIVPMDRDMRVWLTKFHPEISEVSKNIPGVVEKWIGFTGEERGRMSTPTQKFVRFRYPLIDRNITREDVLAWFNRHGMKPPPRSVCNFCYANGLDSFKEMHNQRPKDWAMAVEVDEAVRYHLPGVKAACYVSATCIPLKELERQEFRLTPYQVASLKKKRQPDMRSLFVPPPAPDLTSEDMEDWGCDSGACFL